MAVKPQDQPDFKGVVQERQERAAKICRDVYAGTLRLRDKESEYLPQFPKEPDAKYKSRVEQSVLFNAFKRTVKGLVGMVFRKPLQLSDDVPQLLQDDAENIDLRGRDLGEFARDLFEEAWQDGHALIFVDWQKVEPGAIETLADEQAAGTRPYWLIIPKTDVLRAKVFSDRGRPVLREFAYRQTAVVDDGRYGEKEVERIREYRLETIVDERGEERTAVVFEVHEKRKDEKGAETWASIESGVMDGNMRRIPVKSCYVNRTGFMESEPPLLDLALENIRHFRVQSDRDNSLHIAGIPIPIFMGIEEGEEKGVGTDMGISLPLGGDAKYLEPTGASLDASADVLDASERHMALLGLSMLHSDSRAPETATSKRIDKSESDSALSAAVKGLVGALRGALELHAEWYGQEFTGDVAANTDFETIGIDPQLFREVREAVRDGMLSVDTMWEILERGEVLPEGFDPDVEKDRILSGEATALEAFRRREQGDLAA